MGIDDSKFSGDVLQAVITQFRPEHVRGSGVTCVAAECTGTPANGSGYAPELDDQKTPARELVERIASELRCAGFKVETAVEVGDIREKIIDFASDWDADLIVVGSHGRRGIPRFLLGSVAEFVARHAKCSVEIVRTSVRG